MRMKKFTPLSTPSGASPPRSPVGVYFAPANADTTNLLVEITENTPIRLLAETEFHVFSAYDATCQSPLAYLLRYRDYSEFRAASDVPLQVFAALACLITDDLAYANMALTHDVPVWFVVSSNNESNHHGHTLKTVWGEAVSLMPLMPHDAVGKIFLCFSLFRLLNDMAFSFTPFEGEFQIPTPDGLITFVCPPVTSPDQIISLLSQPLISCKSVTIETTSLCNLSCDYCPNSKFERPKIFMKENTFFRIIDALANYEPDFMGEIRPHLYGEPLLDNRLEDFVRYTRHRLPKAQVAIFTNGCFLTSERYLALKAAGVSHFHISQHTPTAPAGLADMLSDIKTYHPEHYTVSYNIAYLAEHKMNRGGLLQLETKPLPDKYYVRCASSRDLTFNVHGNAILCCNDYFGKHVFGVSDETSVRNIWENVEYCQLRNKLFFGLLPLPICQKCMDNIVKTDEMF